MNLFEELMIAMVQLADVSLKVSSQGRLDLLRVGP